MLVVYWCVWRRDMRRKVNWVRLKLRFLTTIFRIIHIVASKNQSDNCKLEFNYSIQKKIDFIIPIVMEKCMQRNADWPDGSLGDNALFLHYAPPIVFSCNWVSVFALYSNVFWNVSVLQLDGWESKMDELAEMIKKKYAPLSARHSLRLYGSHSPSRMSLTNGFVFRVTPPSSTANEEEAAVTTPSNHITVLQEPVNCFPKHFRRTRPCT